LLKLIPIMMLVIVGQTVSFSPCLLASNSALPNADFVGPTIEHTAISDSIEMGTTHQIKAVVTDNVGVETVLLFYRVVGSHDYKRVQMFGIAGTDEYTITLSDTETQEPGIEYYFQAIDHAGNSLLYGYSFSPLLLNIAKNATQESPAQAQAEKDDQTLATKPARKVNKWVWIGLSVIAVGVVAAIAGGGDDTDTNTATKPDTGTIVISGPGP